MEYIFLVIYFTSTVLHLIASLKENQQLRNITKGFILAGLIGFYVFATTCFNWTVLVALIFSLLGDLFLIIRNDKFFVIGGASFILSHIFYMISMYQEPNIDFIGIFIAIVCYMSLFILTSSRFKKDKLSLGLFFYLFINVLMNMTSFIRFAGSGNNLYLIGCIGALLFYISDVTLFEKRNKESKISHKVLEFIVMFTYALGELLLTISFL